MTVTGLAGPDELSVALAGTLVGDLFAGATGLRVPALADGSDQWRDRAGLIESGWQSAAPTLKANFGPTVEGVGGALILNSTAAGPGCRVLVSQIDLGGVSTGDNCRAGTGLPAASLDLHTVYGTCLPAMTWATAAMLSARFPTVTPAGRVPLRDEKCAKKPDLQLVDGGYFEGSGLGTIADLAPELAKLVLDHNAGVLRPPDPDGDGSVTMSGTSSVANVLVVPVVVYLEDQTRADLDRPPATLAPELFVPLVGRAARAQWIASGTWAQRVSDALADPCPMDNTTCGMAVEQIRKTLPGAFVIVAPVTRPSVDAPLGWTLSQDSRARLTSALDSQASESCREQRVEGYACLHELLQVLSND